jgi:hypothetical protein
VVLGMARFRPVSNQITRKTAGVLGVIDCFDLEILGDNVIDGEIVPLIYTSCQYMYQKFILIFLRT